MSEPREPELAIAAEKRDVLGHLCFTLHFVVMLYIIAGWALPWRAALTLYVVFIPAIYVQWQMNKDTCILNNLETWLRTGEWRNKTFNPEEGQWVLTLVTNVTGLNVTARQIDVLTYAVLILGWMLALARIVWRV